MTLAFDGRAFCRRFDSIDRVLRVLVCAARHAKWQIEIWTDGNLRPDAARFRECARPASEASDSHASVLWSPDTEILPCDLPTVSTLHDVNPLLPDGRNPLARWVRRRRFRRRVGACLAQTDRLATDTHDANQRIARAFPGSQDKLSVVPLFVDQDLRPLQGEEGARILRNLGLRPGFILFVGSLRRHKNWDGLLRAYAALPPALRAEHPLVFAGRAKRAHKEVEQLATTLSVWNNVRILGVVDETVLHALYGSAALLACPSFMEGFGFPPLEAMACGIPVVASDRTCMPEVLGGAALYVDPGSVESIARGIRTVFEDRKTREKLVEAGFAQAAGYTPARTAEAMSRVLDQLNVSREKGR